jgi:hypothetical protein
MKKKQQTRRGRPPGSTGKARGAVLQFRVSDQENAGFGQAAELAGLTVSAWARERLRQMCRRELEEHGRIVPFLASHG